MQKIKKIYKYFIFNEYLCIIYKNAGINEKHTKIMRRDGSAYVVQVDAGGGKCWRKTSERGRKRIFLIIINICIYKKIPLRVIGEALPCKSNFFARILRVYI